MIETVTFAIVLSGGIMLSQPDDQGKKAVNSIAFATYKYTGLEDAVKPVAKDIEKRYVPKVLRDAGISTYFMYRLIHDQQLVYSWSF